MSPARPREPADAWNHRRVQIEEVPAFDAWELAASFGDTPWLTLLEAPDTPSELGRWAYVCADPFWILGTKRGQAWAGPPGAEGEVEVEGGPLAELAATLERFRSVHVALDAQLPEAELPPFRGGAVGYLGYELLYLIEAVPDRGRDDLALPDLRLMWCDLVYATDLVNRRSFVCATGFGPDADAATDAAAHRLAQGRARARARAAGPDPEPGRSRTDELRARSAARRAQHPRLDGRELEAAQIHPTISKPDYLASIAAIQAAILAGQVFEVCLTQRFDVDIDSAGQLDGWTLYEVLRAINPAPMSAYLRTPEAEILSSSPERFVNLDRSGRIETRPIKGTRPRGHTPAEDQALADDLRGADKDRAENLMIVDLCRNDLGKVARFGSVEVTGLCEVLPYAFTWQMVSTIGAHLREGLGPVDLIRACFPGGSMTGAPKIEAMKLIDALEPTKRGVFSGAIGYFDFDGALDLSIVIRTLIQTPTQLCFHVGGAIVADSDPEAEYQETLDKAHGLVLAIELAREDEQQGREA